MTDDKRLPLHGVRALEFAHTVMGPSCGLILADFGAEVIKVEPLEGDRTRSLGGFGAGFFGFYNRNKKGVAVDHDSPAGREVLRRLIASADVMFENFAPGAMAKRGLGWDGVSKINPRLVYCSLKGFLPGPYEKRAALDEVVQMMGGLAYMTGPPGQPLRAGTSVIDVAGGTYGAMAIAMALRERDRTGRGQLVESALFESTAFLMGQHLAAGAISGEPVPPMPARKSSWAVYQPFDTADGHKIFVGIVSDRQWDRFCDVFGLAALKADARFQTNNDRIAARHSLIPLLEPVFRAMPRAELERKALEAEISFAPVARPEELLDDPHLLASGALQSTTLPDGTVVKLPLLPVRVDGALLPKRLDPPPLGRDTRAVLADLGYAPREIEALVADRTVVAA